VKNERDLLKTYTRTVQSGSVVPGQTEVKNHTMFNRGRFGERKTDRWDPENKVSTQREGGINANADCQRHPILEGLYKGGKRKELEGRQKTLY